MSYTSRQSTVLEIKRQNYGGTSTTNGKYFVVGECGITGHTTYLQHDGSMRTACVNGWFDGIGEVGSAICKFHTR